MQNTFKTLLSFLFLLSSFASFAQFGWVAQPSGTTTDLNAIYANGPFSVYVVGNNGVARRTSNKGATWTNMNLGSTLTHNRIRFDGTLGTMVGANQEILRTTNAGSSWASVGVGTTTLHDFFFPNGTNGWVVGDVSNGFGLLYNTQNSQTAFHPDIVNKVLRGIYFTTSVNGFAVGDGGVILRTFNNMNWTRVTSNTPRQLNKVEFLNANSGIIVGNFGVILKTTDGGNTWTQVPTGTTANLNGVYYPDANNIFVCGDNGTVLFSNNGGLTWQAEPTNTTAKLTGIHGDGISDIWVCGYNGTILYRTLLSGVANSYKTANLKANLFPNPATENFTLTISGLKENATAEVVILNALGKEMQQFKIKKDQPLFLDTKNLAVGSYLYKVIETKGSLLTGKFLVQ